MIEAKNVSFQYDSKGFRLQDISLKLEEGLIYTLVGENGSGKTTLLKLLYGIFPPKSGEVAADPENASRIPSGGCLYRRTMV